MIEIRQETPNDYKEVYELVQNTFKSAEHTDGDEQDLVERLRKSNAFVPELSLVAVENNKIVGQILFTKLKVGETIQLALAPVSVDVEHQKKGIGGLLIKEGHAMAKKLGYEFSILLGHPTYYPKFGYKKASDFGIKCPFDVPDEYFMAINLQGKNTQLNAEVEYPKEFFEK